MHTLGATRLSTQASCHPGRALLKVVRLTYKLPQRACRHWCTASRERGHPKRHAFDIVALKALLHTKLINVAV